MLPGHDLPFGRMLHWIALGDRLLGRRETTGFNDRAEVLDEAEKCPVLGRVEFGGPIEVGHIRDPHPPPRGCCSWPILRERLSPRYVRPAPPAGVSWHRSAASPSGRTWQASRRRGARRFK